LHLHDYDQKYRAIIVWKGNAPCPCPITLKLIKAITCELMFEYGCVSHNADLRETGETSSNRLVHADCKLVYLDNMLMLMLRTSCLRTYKFDPS
jgi:hypothetical protein